MEQIVDLFVNNGIGVAVVIFSGFALKYMFDKYTAARDIAHQQQSQQNARIAELATAVNNNTIVLTQLVEKMEVKE